MRSTVACNRVKKNGESVCECDGLLLPSPNPSPQRRSERAKRKAGGRRWNKRKKEEKQEKGGRVGWYSWADVSLTEALLLLFAGIRSSGPCGACVWEE